MKSHRLQLRLCVLAVQILIHIHKKKLAAPEHIKWSGNDFQMCDQLPHTFLCSDQRTEISYRKQNKSAVLFILKKVHSFSKY